MILILKIIKIS